MPPAYSGKLLRVDLTHRTTAVEEIPEATLRKYLGGSGLGARILYDEVPAGIDPLGPENKLILTIGPFTQAVSIMSRRWHAVAKSPLTGVFGEGDCGGSFGPKLAEAGIDALVIEGKASEPVYILVNDGKAEIRPAGDLWGKDTIAVHEFAKAQISPKAEVVCIGPAGEKQALLAGLFNDGHEGRAAGRTGLGAVAGSKNLKAVISYGSRRPEIANRSGFAKLSKQMTPGILEKATNLHKFGTGGGIVGFEVIGDLPIKNWVQGNWSPEVENISGQTMAATILTGYYHCAACVIGCGRQVTVDAGPSAGKQSAGPEYESLASLGSMTLTDDLKAIVVAVEWCNRYGLDSISTGAAIAFAMEAYEKGIITDEDTKGLKLTWGNGEAVVEMVQRIGRRDEGLGWLLGQGVKRAAEKLGKGAEEFAIHAKGMELPMHDPRAHNSAALSYATSNRGACHLAGWTHGFETRAVATDLGYDKLVDRFGAEGKGEFVAKAQNLMCVYDSLMACKFYVLGGVRAPLLAEWLQHATGWEVTPEELLKTGERIYNLKRMFNVREGVRRKDDTISSRILTLKRGTGGAADSLPDLESMLNQYYAYRGWDDDGVPTPSRLEELGLLETVPA